MATTAKRARNKPAARKPARKSAAAKTVKKSAARRTAPPPPRARKSAPSKPAKKSGVRKAVSKTAARPPVKKSAAVKLPAKRQPEAAKKSTKGLTAPQKTARTSSGKRPQSLPAAPAKRASQTLSPEAKKNLAARHLWELVEEKKRRAAQPPAWQNIGHHDHAASGSRTVETTPPNSEPEKFHVGGQLDRGGR